MMNVDSAQWKCVCTLRTHSGFRLDGFPGQALAGI